MKHYKQLDNIAALPNMEYFGYLWYSDSEKPVVLKGERVSVSKGTNHPFIVEGNLISLNGLVSINIKQVGSRQLITQFDVEIIKKDERLKVEKLMYTPHKLEGYRELVFEQVWALESDSQCCGWESYRPAYQYFVELK